MRRLHLALSLSVALSLGAAVAKPAMAAHNPAVADCVANARLTHTYSAAQLENALATLPTDIKQYTDCYDVIQRALLIKLGRLKGGGSAGSSTGSGGSFLPLPLLIVLIVLVVAAGAFAVVAIRRRR